MAIKIDAGHAVVARSFLVWTVPRLRLPNQEIGHLTLFDFILKGFWDEVAKKFKVRAASIHWQQGRHLYLCKRKTIQSGLFFTVVQLSRTKPEAESLIE